MIKQVSSAYEGYVIADRTKSEFYAEGPEEFPEAWAFYAEPEKATFFEDAELAQKEIDSLDIDSSEYEIIFMKQHIHTEFLD